MDVAPLDLAATVRAEAARRGVRQDAIMAATDLSQRATSRRMQGQVQWRAGELDAVARLLGMTVDDLLALARRDADLRSA